MQIIDPSIPENNLKIDSRENRPSIRDVRELTLALFFFRHL
jgi:hypothetical protein